MIKKTILNQLKIKHLNIKKRMKMIKKEEILILISKSIDKIAEEKLKNTEYGKKLYESGWLIINKKLIFNKISFIAYSIMAFLWWKSFNGSVSYLEYLMIFLVAFLFNFMSSIRPKKLEIKLLKNEISYQVFDKNNVDDELFNKVIKFCQQENMASVFHDYVCDEGKTYRSILHFMQFYSMINNQYNDQ